MRHDFLIKRSRGFPAIVVFTRDERKEIERERERPELLQRGGDEKEAVAEALVSCRCCVRRNEKGKRGEEAGAAVRRQHGKDARRGGAGSCGRKTREEKQRGRAKEEEEKEKKERRKAVSSKF
ncbi:hypothetical protein JCGZ_12833 [Jatropha curcas]|uniref:Uncharacterized protein n=1 Tax=Jatropha curcas TaxID=180498 RepID=A0A067KR34_JATCU|nr:hypothetical protein JCGZ_12833 [Jatropha curcas]